MNKPRRTLAVLALVAPLAAGCDKLGIETSAAVAARKEADSKAIGAACRHAGRAIEDCYTLNKQADRAAVFAGWREMNDYMRDKKIAEVVPKIEPPPPAPPPARKPAATDDDEHDDDTRDAKPAKKVAKH
jgi:hypothetical protein